MGEDQAPIQRGLGRDFRFYMVARSVSLVGDRIGLIALVFLVIRLGNGFPAALGLFYLARVAPMLVGGLLAGVIVDHFNRRVLMVASDLGRAVLLMVVPSVSSFTLWTLYPMVIVLYGLTLMFDTAAQAALPDVVPEAGMTRANGIVRAVNTSADLAYAVGGGLVYVFDIRTPFFIDAATFVFSAMMVGRMRIPARSAGPFPRVRETWARLGEGLRFLISNPFLKWSSITLSIAPLAGGVMFVVVPLYADRVLTAGHLVGPLRNGAFRFSVLEVSLGIGALFGSLVAVRLATRWPRGRVFGVGILGMGCVDVMFAAIKNLYAAIPVMAVHGLCNSLFIVSGVTLLQQLTPSDVRGRVIAAQSSLIYGALAAGSALGGVLLEHLSLSTMWLALGSLIALSSLFIWLRPEVRGQA